MVLVDMEGTCAISSFSFHKTYQIIMYVITSILGTTCVVFICLTIIRDKKLWTVINGLVVVEALGDLPSTLIIPVIETIRTVSSTASNSYALCSVSEHINIFSFSWTFASFVIIGILRYLVLCIDVKIAKNLKNLALMILPALINSVVRTTASLVLFGLSNSCLHPRADCRISHGALALTSNSRGRKELSIYNLINGLDLGLTMLWSTIVILLHIKIYKKVRSISAHLRSFKSNGSNTDSVKRRRACSISNDVISPVSLFVHVFIFVSAYSTILLYCRLETLDKIYDMRYHSILATVQAVVTLGDPIIYVIFSKQFRKSLCIRLNLLVPFLKKDFQTDSSFSRITRSAKSVSLKRNCVFKMESVNL